MLMKLVYKIIRYSHFFLILKASVIFASKISTKFYKMKQRMKMDLYVFQKSLFFERVVFKYSLRVKVCMSHLKPKKKLQILMPAC